MVDSNDTRHKLQWIEDCSYVTARDMVQRINDLTQERNELRTECDLLRDANARLKAELSKWNIHGWWDPDG